MCLCVIFSTEFELRLCFRDSLSFAVIWVQSRGFHAAHATILPCSSDVHRHVRAPSFRPCSLPCSLPFLHPGCVAESLSSGRDLCSSPYIFWRGLRTAVIDTAPSPRCLTCGVGSDCYATPGHVRNQIATMTMKDLEGPCLSLVIMSLFSNTPSSPDAFFIFTSPLSPLLRPVASPCVVSQGLVCASTLYSFPWKKLPTA